MTNLANELEALAARATAGVLSTAERHIPEEYIECPVCDGDGEVLASDYCNIDGKALGVQFYGIGNEFGAHEALWSKVMENLPTILSALRAREPSDEMVERVARALFDDHWQDDPELIVVPWSDDHGNCICEIEREAWRRAARAAIHAMENSDAG